MANAAERVQKSGNRVQAVPASLEGLEGVFAQLAAEHREVTKLVRRLLASRTDDARARRNLWAEIGRAVIAHERAELQEVYTAFQAYPSLQSVVDEHAHQAHRLEALVDELDATPVQTQIWRLAFQRFEATLKQHVLEEETEFFPLAVSAMGRDKAEKLTLSYLTAKRHLLQGL